MADLEVQPSWPKVREIGIELARGGPNGNMNEQAKALVARTELLMEQKASKSEIVQGQYSFTTLVSFNAVKTTIPANSTVVIEEAGLNQGTNIWDGTTLTKSTFDPFSQSKSYTDTKVADIGVEQGLGTDISVAIIDASDNRTWLEADGAGKPTAYSKSVLVEAVTPTIDASVQAGVAASGIAQVPDPNLSIAIVDASDSRTWLEADGAGKPTAYSKSLLVEVVTPAIQSEVASVGIDQTTVPFTSVAIVDKDENRTWLEANEAGKPTVYAAQLIAEAISLGDVVTPTKVRSPYQTTEIKTVSGPDIVCWGDSMTAGAGGNGTTYPNVLKTLLQAAGSMANTYNMGVGGETSPTICARQGGNPFLINVTGGIIPADTTPVTVTLEQLDGQTVRPLLQGSTTWTGVFDGIAGVLNLVEPSGSSSSWQADNYYTFARTIPGTQLTVNRPKPFYLDVAAARLGDIHVIWIGQNGPSTARAISDAKAIIQRMKSLQKRFLVISKPTSTDADDSLFFAEFGRQFIPIRKYMVLYGLQDAGITPTTQDNTDIAAGTVPTSLRTDSVHWTAQGYIILANLIFNRIKELEWI